jgi:hypothetical protein
LSIGATLAKARGEGGLTVAQVSQRTRIRETIIRDIERGDFSSCGGDFYARGHIRAIARVVGVESGPLIAEYDAARTVPDALQAESGQPPGSADHHHDGWGSLTAPGTQTAPQPRYTPGGITAAEAFRPSMPLSIATHRRRPNWTVALAVLLLAAVAFLAYHFASSSPSTRNLSATGSHHKGRTAPPHSASPSARSTPPVTTAGPLTPASEAAFGPGGLGQGDNPGMASLALGGSGWQTDWYATPNFAGLQSGTGLLLDMGKSVTITSAQLTLDSQPGATVQLRVGNSPTLSDLTPVAQATNAGGTLRLQPTSPAAARYVLIWFTRLAPDNAGTYQETVSNVRIAGTS